MYFASFCQKWWRGCGSDPGDKRPGYWHHWSLPRIALCRPVQKPKNWHVLQRRQDPQELGILVSKNGYTRVALKEAKIFSNIILINSEEDILQEIGRSGSSSKRMRKFLCVFHSKSKKSEFKIQNYIICIIITFFYLLMYFASFCRKERGEYYDLLEFFISFFFYS